MKIAGNVTGLGTWETFPPPAHRKFGPVVLEGGDTVELVGDLPDDDSGNRWVVVSATAPDGSTVFAPVGWEMLDHS